MATTTEQVLSRFAVGRRQPSDTFFAVGDNVCQAGRRLGVFDIDEEQLCHKVVERFDCSVPGCVETFDSLFYFDLHYNSVHRYFCSECKKRLPSPHLLDLHLSEHHDSFFLAQSERKPMYRCFVEQCEVISANAPERRHHCIADHKFPHDFRFDKVAKHKSSKKKQQQPSVTTEKMETNVNPTSDGEVKEKPRKYRQKKKPHGNVVPMDVCRGGAGTPAEEEMVEERVPVVDRKSQNVPPSFVPFSFGRGGRGRRGGTSGKNWFQRQSSTPHPSSLETTMVNDLLSALPEPMT